MYNQTSTEVIHNCNFMTWDELIIFPDLTSVIQVVVRLLIAAILGGIIGYERESHGKPAGLRTHMLVALGTAIVVIASRLDGIPQAEMSKVVEGLVAGVGFLGGGSILKLSDKREIRGLTTAASIWSTAAIGIATGLGQVWIAVISVIVVWMILFVMGHWEKYVWKINKNKA